MSKPGFQSKILIIYIVLLASISLASIADSQSYIIVFEGQDDIEFQLKVDSLGLDENANQAGSIDRIELINAVIAELTPGELAVVKQNPNVSYVVNDGLVATPEWWAGKTFQDATGSDEVINSAETPVEYYPWGVRRIGAPSLHKMNPDQFTSNSSANQVVFAIFVVGLLGAGLVSPFGREFVGKNSNRKFLGVFALILSVITLSSCTAIVVLPHVGIMGVGVDVAFLDTGIDMNHPDLEDNYRGGVDFVNDDFTPFDDNGHGTGVSGVAAAVENGFGVIGVAPEIGIYAVKTLRYDEQGTISDLISGIQWAVDRGVSVIGMSLGTEDDNRALYDAIRAAYQRGVLLVAAAGNNGEQVLYPAAYPEVIAVAASTRGDDHAWFSNEGPEVELIAPGMDLLTTSLGGHYSTKSGTSFAVPLVVGVAALMFSVGLNDSVAIRDCLTSTAESLGLSATAQGYGMVDAERAVLCSNP
jgi:subtilisin family serine protease